MGVLLAGAVAWSGARAEPAAEPEMSGAERTQTEGPAALAPAAPPTHSSDTGQLVIRVLGVPTPGVLYLELHDVDRDPSKARGRRWDAPVARTRRETAAGDVEIRFESLAEGRYAVRAYLDQNGNQSLDVGSRGVPREPFAFSNDARAKLGLPRITAASFDYRPPMERIELRMRPGVSVPASSDEASHETDAAEGAGASGAEESRADVP